jgi:hypothetical protein
MRYIFLDESYPPGQMKNKIVMSAWTVEQNRFDSWSPKAPRIHRSRINSILESLDAWAVRGTVKLDDPAIFRSGETDATDDIRAMARRDNVWSQCFLFLVARLTKELVRQASYGGTIDIYFDPKDLKDDHAKALQMTVRHELVELAKLYGSEQGSGLLESLSIRDIKPVEKTTSRNPPHPLQWGTLMAHKLCSSSETVIHNSSRIIGWDMSDIIRRTSQQFDGKSFHDG